MPYEDDYKIWLEEMLIESNPDWVCDGMYDMDFTHEWCGKHCGEDSNYVTPKCLHLYYHHIARADRKTEPSHDLRTETHECVKDTHDKTESTICDFCRYYNSNIPCGSTPSACKEADKFAEEFVNGLKDLRIEADRKTESNSEKPNNSTISKMKQVEQRSCDTCKNKDVEGWKNPCLGCTEFTFYEPKDEPQTCDNCKLKGSTKWCNNQVVCRAYKPKDEPQTDCLWK